MNTKKTAAKTEGEIAEIEGEIAKLKIKLNRDNQRLNNYRYKNGMSTEGENAEKSCSNKHVISNVLKMMMVR